MDQTELDGLTQQLSEEVRTRFPGAPIEQVKVLQYGDDPEIEPGQLLGRIILEAPAGEDANDEKVRERRLQEFHSAHSDAFRELRRDHDRLPVSAVLEFMVGGEGAEGERGPRIKLGIGPRPLVAPGEGQFTPVMARLGREDLETLDTLITAGIAASRAEGVRWALARIRERPAYEQLRAHARQIEDLKAQF
jgi:hypothetical protein